VATIAASCVIFYIHKKGAGVDTEDPSLFKCCFKGNLNKAF